MKSDSIPHSCSNTRLVKVRLAYKSLDDDVSSTEKGRRLREIISLQEKISLEINQELVGCNTNVLVEGQSRRNADEYHGRSDSFKTIVFPKENAKIGDIVRVNINSATAHTLRGEIVA